MTESPQTRRPSVRRVTLLVLGGVALAALANLPGIHAAYRQLRTAKLVIEAQANVPCALQLLHDTGEGFVGSGTQWMSLPADGKEHRLEFVLADAATSRLGIGVDRSGPLPVLQFRNARLVRQEETGVLSERPLEVVAIPDDGDSRVRLVPLVSLSLPEPVAPRSLNVANAATLARRFAPSLLLQAVLLSALLAICLRMRTIRGFISSHVLRVALLFAVCGFVIAMAQVSRFDASPDESLHVLTAHYYDEHWLPPGALDPDLPGYLHRAYGATYLLTTPAEATYLLADKFVQLVHAPGPRDSSFRLFNLALFLLLTIVIASRPRLDPAHILVLVATPQVWYVFTYFNGDALPLCLSLLLAWQLGDPRSSVRGYLDGPAMRGRLAGGLLLGLLTGLLILSKSNYIAFLAFLLFLALWRCATTSGERRRVELKKWALAGAVAVVCVAPFFVADLVQNGLHKADLVLFLRERYGNPTFRPSAVARGDVSGALWLATRGIPVSALFTTHHWHILSFKSFFGVYGYMSIAMPLYYYAVQVILLGGALFYLGWIARKHLFDRTIAIIVAAAASCSLLVVVASIYNSWTYDVQAQGRYLFPALAVALLAWRLIAERLPREIIARQRRVVLFVIPISFVVSAYSFVVFGIAGIPK